MSFLTELIFLSLVGAGDTLPPPLPPPPPDFCVNPPVEEIIDFKELMAIAPGCADFPDYQQQRNCTQDTLAAIRQEVFRWPAPDWCGEGMAVVQFAIDENGVLGEGKIIRSLGEQADEVCREIFERIERDLPIWTPAVQGTRNVAITYNLPIKFKLE